jgi:hypothetical protein
MFFRKLIVDSNYLGLLLAFNASGEVGLLIPTKEEMGKR